MIYDRQEPCSERCQRVVWQFVQDYCATNRINLVSDDCTVFPITRNTGQSVQHKMQRAHNPLIVDPQGHRQHLGKQLVFVNGVS
jgi:hypothetical protein